MAEINVMETIPEKMIIPLKQHKGDICEPLVSKGEVVKVGQKIGECPSDKCAAIHSSVCGEVVSVEESSHPSGNRINSVVIQPIEETECEDFTPFKDSGKEQLISAIKEAGIVENYGTPTHLVLNPPDCDIDTVLINATASEWVGHNYETPLEYASQMLDSLRLLMKAAGASRGVIVLRNDDKDSIDAFDGLDYEGKTIMVSPLIGKRRVDYYFNDQNTDIIVVSQDKIYGKNIFEYFTYNVTGRKVPFRCTPASAGVAICGVKSTKAIHDLVNTGIPYIETVVTVSGQVNNPQHLLVKIGTTFRDVIEACGGYSGEPAKLISNGVITGVAQYEEEVPVTKMTTSIIVQGKDEVLKDISKECIHCARCVDVCPVDLIPNRIAALANQGRFDECKQMHVENCIECGRCSSVCPSKIHIMQLLQYSKEAIAKAYEDMFEKESSNLKLGCACGSE